jgi:hypothetical protein
LKKLSIVGVLVTSFAIGNALALEAISATQTKADDAPTFYGLGSMTCAEVIGTRTTTADDIYARLSFISGVLSGYSLAAHRAGLPTLLEDVQMAPMAAIDKLSLAACRQQPNELYGNVVAIAADGLAAALHEPDNSK